MQPTLGRVKQNIDEEFRINEIAQPDPEGKKFFECSSHEEK
jgi:hypothetical protein